MSAGTPKSPPQVPGDPCSPSCYSSAPCPCPPGQKCKCSPKAAPSGGGPKSPEGTDPAGTDRDDRGGARRSRDDETAKRRPPRKEPDVFYQDALPPPPAAPTDSKTEGVTRDPCPELVGPGHGQWIPDGSHPGEEPSPVGEPREGVTPSTAELNEMSRGGSLDFDELPFAWRSVIDEAGHSPQGADSDRSVGTVYRLDGPKNSVPGASTRWIVEGVGGRVTVRTGSQTAIRRVIDRDGSGARGAYAVVGRDEPDVARGLATGFWVGVAGKPGTNYGMAQFVRPEFTLDKAVTDPAGVAQGGGPDGGFRRRNSAGT